MTTLANPVAADAAADHPDAELSDDKLETSDLGPSADSGDDGDDDGAGLRLHVSLEEKVEIARVAATRLFELVGAGMPVIEVAVEEDQIVVRLRDLAPQLRASNDSRILESIQFLLNKAVNKLAIKRSRLSLDADGFRRRRPDAFDQLATLVAARVVALGKAIAIGPLGQTEVRILGHQVERAGGVTVKVEGPHDQRRLVVAPKVTTAAVTDVAPPPNDQGQAEAEDDTGDHRGRRRRRRR